MNTYISLNRNIDCNYICGKITKSLESFAKHHEVSTDDLIICISIKKSEEQPSIPSLEHKQ
jgi:hypothetical protein